MPRDLRAEAVSRPDSGAVRVTYLGTSTLLFDDGASRLMIDGFITRPGWWTVLGRELRTDESLVDRTLAQVGAERLDAVFVVHSHYDHALDAAYVARSTGATLYGSHSTLNVGRGGGLAESELRAVIPGSEYTVGRFHVTAIGSRHLQNRNPVIRPVLEWALGGEIEDPLVQPAHSTAYNEGGVLDLMIRHGDLRVLVKATADFVPGALRGRSADIVFLGIGGLGKASPEHRDALYDEVVCTLAPRWIIPIHWDDFARPLFEPLRAMPRLMDDTAASLDYLIGQADADRSLTLHLLDTFQSATLPEARAEESPASAWCAGREALRDP
ncbi:MAG: MBL fold metallo-hydrolase [Bacteroidota bacterium]